MKVKQRPLQTNTEGNHFQHDCNFFKKSEKGIFQQKENKRQKHGNTGENEEYQKRVNIQEIEILNIIK